MTDTRDRWLASIAIFKFLKASLLIGAAIAGFKLSHKDVPAALQHSVELLGLDPGRKMTEELIAKASTVSPGKIKALSVGGFIYAAIFLTEGTGLWLGKHWAEWLTVIVTGSLIPIELFEIYKHLSAAKILTLIVNIAIVAYLVFRIHHRRAGAGTQGQAS
jgi:uncharacterized membrane protein (DUF2068 family)